MKRPDDEFRRLLQADIVNLKRRLIQALKQIGESCIAEAKESGNYRNITGNLRRSIGYVIAIDGVVVHMSQMNEQGRSLALSLAGRSKGVQMYVLAGMSYAEVVEAKGKNVITSSELLAEVIVPKIMNQLGFRLK